MPSPVRQEIHQEGRTPDPGRYPPPAGIRAGLDGVHRRVLTDLPLHPEANRGTILVPAHRVARAVREMLWWCCRPEMIHAGQIRLLRRLLGYGPRW